MNLDFEVNYSDLITFVICGRNCGEFIEWYGFINEIDESYQNIYDNAGDVLNELIEKVNNHYPEFLNKSKLEYERELYGCGPLDSRAREEF